MDNEFINNPDCPIKDILYLIQQDDTESIRQALLEVINKSYPDSEIYLYKQGYSIYESKGKEFTPKLLASLNAKESYLKTAEDTLASSNKESIHFDGFHYLSTEDYVQVFTIEKDHSNRGLLITKNNNVINEKYIDTLIRVYNNQIQLLRNKDTDSLTGLLNRQSFDTKIAKTYADLSYKNRSQEHLNGLVFALLDIDFFKSINDNFGHVYGDEVLILFSNAMKKTFRDNDMLFRYGGEEFVVLLSNVNLEQAQSILDRFRHNIENITLPLGNSVTASAGYCEFTNEIPLTSITDRADKALYYSKENGRNKASGYENLIENNELQSMIIDEGDVELF